MSEWRPRDDDGVELSIGALSRAAGVPVNTIRTWERRYGWPVPSRTTGGQRLYAAGTEAQVRLAVRAMAAGHRAAQVVGAPESLLLELLGGAATRPAEPPRDHISAWVDAARRLDGEALDAGFRKELSLLGAERFATERVLPFLRALGDAWISGGLDIFQEHYASERLRDLLSRTTRDLADVARGAAVVLAALPADRHALALHVAALFAAVHGWRPVFLGPDTPVADIVRAVAQSRAEAVVVSVTDVGDGGVPSALRVDQVRALRAALPPDVELLVGGSGAPVHLAGVRFLPHLSALADWVARRSD